MKLIHIRHVLKIPFSCPFNRKASFIPFLFICRSLSIKIPFVFLSTSIRSPCAFPSVSNTLHIRSIFLLVTVYDFYSLLKSAHAGQQFACGTKKDRKSYRPDTHSLSSCVTHFTQSHFLFCSCSSNFDIVLFAKSRVYIHLGTGTLPMTFNYNQPIFVR